LCYEELLRSTAQTRQAAGVLEAILRFLADPLRSDQMARTFVVWDENANTAYHEPEQGQEGNAEEAEEQDAQATQDAQRQAEELRNHLARLLRRCRETESFLYPQPGADWLAALDVDETLMSSLIAFREATHRWLAASVLPVDQLILTLSQELFNEPADLALAYKVALVLKAHTVQHPNKRLPELVEELALIANNQRRFLGFDEADLGYDPKKGVITVSTMHKAKGLEWDRVYLVGLNNYNFPSAQSHDYYRGESWFIQDGLNLEAEAIARLEALHANKLSDYIGGEATEKARIDYTAERLRLFYVGITRAKKELIITWNSGHASFTPKVEAAPFIALQTFWEQRNGKGTEE
jgi:DNA helicase-2/ATP-dependent DNA helicase PcrA